MKFYIFPHDIQYKHKNIWICLQLPATKAKGQDWYLGLQKEKVIPVQISSNTVLKTKELRMNSLEDLFPACTGNNTQYSVEKSRYHLAILQAVLESGILTAFIFISALLTTFKFSALLCKHREGRAIRGLINEEF